MNGDPRAEAFHLLLGGGGPPRAAFSPEGHLLACSGALEAGAWEPLRGPAVALLASPAGGDRLVPFPATPSGQVRLRCLVGARGPWILAEALATPVPPGEVPLPRELALARVQAITQAKARMAGYLAHEVNNPLAGLKNAALLIRGGRGTWRARNATWTSWIRASRASRKWCAPSR